MPDLLLELFSEEIPARMQRQAALDLRKLVTDALVNVGVTYEGATSHATPRRLALQIVGLPARQPDTREEKKGPRVGAPQPAIDGFLKSAGLASLDQAKIEKDAKKGEFYVAVIEKAGRDLPALLAEILPGILRNFPWPKSMRWGKASREAGAPSWVRPLHSILCTFGPETEDPVVVPFSFGGIESGDVTAGHRFLAPGAIRVKRFGDYATKLEAAKVVLDTDRRKDIILADARNLAMAQGLELIEDDGLLEEVAGLVEWPVVLMGEFDARFLDIPAEVVRATIRANQKCFVLRDGAGKLANKFLLVSNIEASDGGKAIAAGNGRVVRARLSDALYFWETDRKPLPDYAGKADKPLDQRLAKLRALNIVFHEKLGTQGERVDRIMKLAEEIAPLVGADPTNARRAAELAKADLTTEVVGEFPEVQGLMGARYAELQNEEPSVCIAIEDHYKPQGPGDRVPADPVAIAVALADKLDTLVGFWAIDEKPTGSKDPFALRRAALGVIRLVLENGLRVDLLGNMVRPFARNAKAFLFANFLASKHSLEKLRGEALVVDSLPTTAELAAIFRHREIESAHDVSRLMMARAIDLLAFFHDRLKVYMRDKGARHDLIDAVLARGEGNDDLLMIVRRVEALGAFLDSEDGRNLLAGTKRAVNILRAEEKKDRAGAFDGEYDATLLTQDEEKTLADALAKAALESGERVKAEDFAGAMRALARLRAPVDAFFEHVTVNAPEPDLRLNRLRLLSTLRRTTAEVADFSKIAG